MSIGTIIGPVALSSTGDSFASSDSPAPEKISGHWWNNNWVIAIAGGTLAALVAAGIIASLSGGAAGRVNIPAQKEVREIAKSSRSAGSSMTAFHGARFTAQIPAEWTTEEREVHKPGYVSSSWYDPSDPTDKLLIDWSRPTAGLTLKQDARPVHDEVSQDAGYEQLYYGLGNLNSVDSWMWEFRVNGHQDIDYFLQDCSVSFAVLGSADPDQFNRLRSSFRESAQSLRATCP
jgi:hypothetical protein